jgi:glycosyltransferase involved in cell wall biosynthesis
MQKVLFLSKSREFGGLEVVLLDWLSQVDYAQVKIAVCCYGTDTLWQRLAKNGSPVDCIRLDISDSQPFWKAFPKWVRLFKSIQPDKIIFLESVLSELDAMPVVAARWASEAQVFLFEANWGRSPIAAPAESQKPRYGLFPGIGLYRFKEILRQRVRGRLARHTFVVSQTIKDNVVRYYGYPAEKISVLYHGVDARRFCPCATERFEFRHANGIPDDAVVVVSHGRLVPRKRVDRILRAFEQLFQKHENLWVVLTCYGPLQEDVEKMVSESPAQSRIRLVKFQTDSSLVLKASDIYVLSSNDEGFGIALIEALATALMCVATDGPGPRDIIANGINGFLVEASDEGVLGGIQRALALNPIERERLAAQARKTVEGRFEIGAAIRMALEAFAIPRCHEK